MKNGGFDVIIGNPPYVEYSKVRREYTVKGYQTESCGNLYAYVLERSITILDKHAWLGLIIPHSIAATYRMNQIQRMLIDVMEGAYSYFSRRPGKLFDGADQCLCIFMGAFKRATVADNPKNISTTYQRWYTEERNNIFGEMKYSPIDLPRQWSHFHVLPKLGDSTESAVLRKITKWKPFGNSVLDSGKEFYCHRIARYFIKSTNFVPYFCSERDGVKRSDDFKVYYVADSIDSLSLHNLDEAASGGKKVIEGIRLNAREKLLMKPLKDQATMATLDLTASLAKGNRALPLLLQATLLFFQENVSQHRQRPEAYKSCGVHQLI